MIGLSLLTLVVGFSSSESAPQEAVVVGQACFFGILARITQAAAHHHDRRVEKAPNKDYIQRIGRLNREE